MPTSSIFAPVVITDHKVADRIAEGLESIGNRTEVSPETSFTPLCSDRCEIRKFVEEMKGKDIN